MKTSFVRNTAIAGGCAIALTLLMVLVGRFHREEAKAPAPEDSLPPRVQKLAGATALASREDEQPVAAPFIVKDTENDSPGTNMVTRIVTFSAEVGGTPPPALQWKVDKGKGFVDIRGATNATFRIGNAQVSDSGYYSLFATNAAGTIRTAPQQIVITEGED
jgi:Immunoglobulin I-set domain